MKDAVLGAAFAAIMSPKSEAEARIDIAKNQRAQYGLREWTPEAPTTDATGQRIVFKDSHGWSYTVHEVRPNGAHVRHLFDPAQPVQRYRVEGRAPTYEEAEAIAYSDAVASGLMVNHDAGGGTRSYCWCRFVVQRPSLD